MKTVSGVTDDGLNDFDPARWEAVKQSDGTYTLYELAWWDDASYADYQADRKQNPADYYDDSEVPYYLLGR